MPLVKQKDVFRSQHTHQQLEFNLISFSELINFCEYRKGAQSGLSRLTVAVTIFLLFILPKELEGNVLRKFWFTHGSLATV